MKNEISQEHKEKVWEYIFKAPEWMRHEYEIKKLRKKSNINQKKYRRSN